MLREAEGGACSFCTSEYEIHGYRDGYSSDNGDAHSRIDITANFGVGFLLLLFSASIAVVESPSLLSLL
jgi:hypothetical protein